MAEPTTSREVIDRLVQAATVADLDAIDALLADDVIEEYPQSGERMRGKANRRAVYEYYPREGAPIVEYAPLIERVVGNEDRWVMTSNQSLVRIVGMGDRYTVIGLVKYPNGEVWHGIQIVELRDLKVVKITSYFAAPFEPATWRAKWVEPMSGPS